jgi:hypothetical protein
MKATKLIINMLVLLANFSLMAQEVKFSGAASKNKVAPGEQFKLTYSINTNTSSFSGPDLSAFDVYSGPNQTFAFNDVNGRITQTLSFYYILAARKPGKITIGPATVRVGNGRLESNPVEIEVSASARNQGQTQQGKNQQSQGSGREDNLYIKAIVSKSTAYLGEPLTVTYKVYNRYPMVNFSDVKIPSFNGFFTEEIAMDKNGKSVTEVINGVQYTTVEIKKTLLIPQKSGKLEIPTLDATFIVRERTTPQSIFDQLLGGGYRDVEVKVKSKPLILDVLPLPPGGKPADFSGAVGQYTFDVSSGSDKLKSGDAFNLKMTIRGKGNLKLIENPVIQVPAEIELYDPQVKESVQVNSGGMSGSKTFEYLMIPRAGGTYTIGPFSFAYFDPQRKTYQVLSSPAIRLEVEKTAGDQRISGRSSSKSGTRVIASDIRFNKTSVKSFTPTDERGFLFSSGFYLISILPPLAVVGLLVYRRRKQHRLEKGAFYRTREAGQAAKKRLRQAQELEMAGKNDAFYEEIFRALYGYLGDKLQIPVSSISREVIAAKLKDKQTGQELQVKLFNVLDNCEMARYAPSAVAGMKEVYQQSLEVITGLENSLKS